VSADGRVLNEWQLVFVEDGSGWYVSDDGVRSPVRAHDLIIVRPGVWHQYAPRRESGWTEYWVGFTGIVFEEAVAAVGLASGPGVIACPRPSELHDAYQELLSRASENDTAGHVVMVAAVLRMIGLIGSWVAGDREEGYSVTVQRAVGIMTEQLDGSLSVAALASRVGLSESALRRRFARETGMSPYHFYNMLRVNRIKMELAHSSAPLSTVAEKLGFTDAFHLSRVFKQYTGLAPSDWRVSGG
jgi:AraC-like DNA-binding protein